MLADYLIVGAGIIGSSIARELAKKRLGRIVVLEKEDRFGCHASGRNSGVIHSGINQKPGSMKARMCLDGSRKLRQFCLERRIAMNECGTLVIARNEPEESVLHSLLHWGEACGVPDLKIITQQELQNREPVANGHCALFSPTGATVDSVGLLHAVIEDAKSLGAEFELSRKALHIDPEKHIVSTSEKQYEFTHLINCAGLYADKMAHAMGAGTDLTIVPFRGEYWEVLQCPVRSMIYQPPNLKFPFLSIHLTRETSGQVLAGPSAVLSFGRESYQKEWNLKETKEMVTSAQFLGLIRNRQFRDMAMQNWMTSVSTSAFIDSIRSLITVPIPKSRVRPYRSGIRAQVVDRSGNMVEDLMVEYRDRSTHVLNAVSPGMTCSLSFAEYVVASIINRNTKSEKVLPLSPA